AAEAEVTELLRAFAKEHGSSARAIDVVSRNTPELQSVIATQLQAKLTELGGDLTVPSLLDGSIHERMADIAMLRLVLTTLTTGARLEETLGAPGFVGRTGVTQSHTMPPVFTTLLEQLPTDHPAKAAYVHQINSRLEETRDSSGDGYYLQPSGHGWTKQVHVDGQRQQSDVMLSFPEMRNAGDNDALSEQAYRRQGRGTVSPTTAAMARITWGADQILDESRLRLGQIFEDNPALHA